MRPRKLTVIWSLAIVVVPFVKKVPLSVPSSGSFRLLLLKRVNVSKTLESRLRLRSLVTVNVIPVWCHPMTRCLIKRWTRWFQTGNL